MRLVKKQFCAYSYFSLVCDNTSAFLFPLGRCRMTLAARTPVTIRLSATVWWEISTAAAPTITRAKPAQSVRTTARPTAVKVMHLEKPLSIISKYIYVNKAQTICPADLLYHFFHPKWLTVAQLLWQQMTPKSGCGISPPMCAVPTDAASACLPGTSAAPVSRASRAPTATRVSH